jgi:predicted dehydrogenase
MSALVRDPLDIKLAMLGMVDGNGHPYSWSAIFNGFDPEAMARCPYAAIPEYLGKQPPETLGVPGARVTHVWTEDPAEAEAIAAASLVPQVVSAPEEVIGEVDAVFLPTDKGWEHVERARPFVEAGLPLFVDKPLVDNEADLRTFCAWVEERAAIMSSSCMRYCKEFMPYRASTANLGELRYASITTPKSWERYGIHALESIYPILGPGFVSARHSGDERANVVHFRHQGGAEAVVVALEDMYGGFGCLQLAGTQGQAQAVSADSYFAFKSQLVAFIDYLRSGKLPFPWAETVELMKMVIAGIRSREQGGAEIRLEEIKER